jgi:hypothetical protein
LLLAAPLAVVRRPSFHKLARCHLPSQLRSACNLQLVGALLSHAEPCLPTLSPAQLGQTVWALKRLAYTPTQAWFDALYGASQPLLPQLSGLEAALLLRSLAVIKVRLICGAGHSTPSLHKVLCSHDVTLCCRCTTRTQAPAPPAAWLSALLGHVEELLPDMKPRHLSMLMMGMAGLQVRWPLILLTESFGRTHTMARRRSRAQLVGVLTCPDMPGALLTPLFFSVRPPIAACCSAAVAPRCRRRRARG